MEKTVIALPTSDKITIDGHFGHTKEFVLFSCVEGEIKEKMFVTPPPHAPGVLPKFLREQGVDVIISGGMGAKATQLFAHNNIEVVLGAQGDIESNVATYLNGKLESTGSSCSHNHDHDHGDHVCRSKTDPNHKCSH